MQRIAQGLGKSDALCDSNSDFILFYRHCAKCIEGNSIELLESFGFRQYVEFCELELQLLTTTRILPGWSETVETIILEAATAPGWGGESTVTSQTTTTTPGGPVVGTGLGGIVLPPDGGSECRSSFWTGLFRSCDT
jgi:hypothetical protein